MSFVHLPSPTRFPLNITGGDALFFSSLAFVLTGRSRTPRRPRSPGSKSKEFTSGDASSIHSVHVCLGGTSVTAPLECCRHPPPTLSFLHLWGDLTTAPPSCPPSTVSSEQSHQFTNSMILACTSLLLAFWLNPCLTPPPPTTWVLGSP